MNSGRTLTSRLLLITKAQAPSCKAQNQKVSLKTFRCIILCHGGFHQPLTQNLTKIVLPVRQARLKVYQVNHIANLRASQVSACLHITQASYK